MAVTERTRRAGIAAVLALVTGGGGFAAIGARVATATGQDGRPAGVAIVSVTQGGPAAQAGLRRGDVIRPASRTPTPDATSLAQVLAAARPGQTVSVTVARDAGTLPVQVRLGEL
jgi:S1-C subfamily serine protease